VGIVFRNAYNAVYELRLSSSWHPSQLLPKHPVWDATGGNGTVFAVNTDSTGFFN
jgi:hypothetical protein